MHTDDLTSAIGALSARMTALEGALVALAPQATQARARSIAVYDEFAQQILGRYIGLPVDDEYLSMLRQSFDDIRALIGSDRS